MLQEVAAAAAAAASVNSNDSLEPSDHFQELL